MTEHANTASTALVISYSSIESDPRVRRQITWLNEAGWVVDVLGLGPDTIPSVRESFVIGAPKVWALRPIRLALAHLIFSNRSLYQRLVLDRVPKELLTRVHNGSYGLIVFNETEFVPWAAQIKASAGGSATHLHLDLHEYRPPTRRRNTLGGKLTSPHYRWIRSFIGNSAFVSRSVVCSPIGELYAREFDIAPLSVIQNAPTLVLQDPSPIDPAEIRLLYHGLAGYDRGFSEMLAAMQMLPEHFSMTFMLMPDEAVHAQLRNEIALHPAKDRIHIVAPAPMPEIAQYINKYDLEVIFFRPRSKNLEFALPNKFFESIQGRLGLIVNEGRTMAPIVRELGNGLVVKGFEGSDLAAALTPLTAVEVADMKSASAQAAHHLNATAEGKVFLQSVSGTSV